MPELHGFEWSVLILIALICGVTKTGLPGAGILMVPLAAAVFPAKVSTGIILPMLIIGDIFAVAYYKRHAVWKNILPLIPWAMAGVIIGSFAMTKVNDQQLRPIIGAIVLTMLILNYIRLRRGSTDLPIPTQWWFAAIMGLLAGMTTMMANAAGPIMTIYLLAMQLPKQEFIGTGAWYFFLMNCFKVPFSAHLNLINAQSLWINLMILPVIVVGAILGILIVNYIPQKAFTAVVQILAAVGAIYLFF
jgi:uncharacterized membrane protein YfcA